MSVEDAVKETTDQEIDDLIHPQEKSVEKTEREIAEDAYYNQFIEDEGAEDYEVVDVEWS